MDKSTLELELYNAIICNNTFKEYSTCIFERDTIINKYNSYNTSLLSKAVIAAIDSYYMLPELDLKYRLPLIDGIIYYQDIFFKLEENFENLDEESQVLLIMKEFEHNEEKNKRNKINFISPLSLPPRIPTSSIE